MPSKTEAPQIPLETHCSLYPELAAIVQKCSRPEAWFIKHHMLETPANTNPHVFHLETTTKFPIAQAGLVIATQIREAVLDCLKTPDGKVMRFHVWIRTCEESWLRRAQYGLPSRSYNNPNTNSINTNTNTDPIANHQRKRNQIIHISIMLDTHTNHAKRILHRLPTNFISKAQGISVYTQSKWVYQAKLDTMSRVRHRLAWFDLIASDAVGMRGPYMFWSNLQFEWEVDAAVAGVEGEVGAMGAACRNLVKSGVHRGGTGVPV